MTEEVTETRTKRVDKLVDEETGVITFRAFDDDGNAMDAATLDPSELSDDVQEKAVIHGLLYKVGNAASNKSGQEAVDAIVKVVEQLKAGNWNVRRQGNTVKMSKEELTEKLSSMTPEAAANAKAALAAIGIVI